MTLDDELTCRACGDVIKETDYDWKYWHLFLSLKATGICEMCHRNGYNEL